MDKILGDNIFGKLNGLIWGAFFGVVSFQVLGPNVWEYLHDTGGVDYKQAYWIFTYTYFLILPVWFVGWIIWNSKAIKAMLPDFRFLQANTETKLFLGGLLGFVAIQCVITACIFSFHQASSSYFYILFFYAIGCVILLVCCFYFSIKRIKEGDLPVKINRKTLATENEPIAAIPLPPEPNDPLVATEEKAEILPATKTVSRREILQFTTPAVLLFIILFSAGFAFLNQWQNPLNSSRLPSRSAGDRGFAVQNLKNVIDSVHKRIGAIGDSLKQAKPADDIAANVVNWVVIADTTVKAKPDQKPGNAMVTRISSVVYPDPAMAAYADSLYQLRCQLLTLLNSADIKYSQAALDAKESDTFKDSIIAADSNFINQVEQVEKKIASTFTLSVPKVMNAKDLEVLETLRGLFAEISNASKRTAQSLLGMQLRAVQAKGLMLLLSLFFTMLALYVFIAKNQEIENAGLKELNERKRLKEEVNEKDIIGKEKRIAGNAGLSGSLWIFLTINAWLLVPIFKMVKNEEVDLKSPYKAITFSSPAKDFTGGALSTSKTKKDAVADSSYTRYYRVDVYVRDSSQGKNYEEIKAALEDVKNKVDPITNY